MKILLVLPAAEQLRVTEAQNKVPKRAMLRFSILSLTAVAGATPAGHEVKICDENVQPLDFETDADLIGVSFMTALADRAYEIAGAFRKRGKIVVAGGFHPTLCTGEALEHFDAVVKGDAEGAWPELLRDFTQGRMKKVYQQAKQCDLGQVRTPRRDLLEATARHYVTTNAVQTGRGCRHACRYCSITAFHGGTHRTRPVDQVIEEIKTLPKDFIFVDDNIVADPEYAIRLFEKLSPLKKRWVSQCSLKIADDPELLATAYRAGCRGLFIGIETLAVENLAAVSKQFNAQHDYFRRIAAIRKRGIGIVAGMIVGMDHDDTFVFENTLRFLQKTGIEVLQLNILTPLPGTPLYDDFEQAGRIVDHNWSRYDFRHCVIEPARMSAAQLKDGSDWLYSRFYRLDQILIRTVKTLFTVGWVPAWLTWRLGMTYRYDNKREKVKGRNPCPRPTLFEKIRRWVKRTIRDTTEGGGRRRVSAGHRRIAGV